MPAPVLAPEDEHAYRAAPPPRRAYGGKLLLATAAVMVAVVAAAACTSSSGATGPAKVTTTSVAIPVDVRVDGTTELHDGQGVNVHVTAKSGSQVFGFEARLCAGGTTFHFDADMRPTRTGKCTSKPLSPASDNYQEVRAAAPYLSADSVFKAGVGSDQFVLQNGTPVTITCRHGHPCQLVLKVQFPNGFAILAYPLTYA